MPKSRVSKSRKSRKSIMKGGMIRSGTVVSNLPKRSKISKKGKKSIMKGGMIRGGTVVSNLPKRSKRVNRTRNSSKSKKLSKKNYKK